MIKLLILTRSCYQPVNTIHKLHKKLILCIMYLFILLHKGPVLCDSPPAPIIKPNNQPEPYNKYRHYSSSPITLHSFIHTCFDFPIKSDTINVSIILLNVKLPDIIKTPIKN